MLLRETLLGRYSIEKKIGEGGFGIVYLAKDTRIERKVAIKTIASDSDSSEFDEALRLFLREIQAIAKLDHPHILPLYDFGETTIQEANYTYMVMPYREEGTLGNWLKQRKDNKVHFPSLEDVAYILDQAADALQQAHNHNILHLDVKPSNFLIRANKENPNRPYLLLADFGIAKFVNTSAELTKVRRGTPYYMPPEQWDKNRVPEPASDQYALAVTIYQLLTYKQVFEGDNELQIQFQHLNDRPTPPSTLNPLIPSEIDTVILTALAKDPKKRYSTITAFADAFKQALANNASTRVILSISKTEAETGGSYPLKLSDGRQITVAVPAGVQDGQEIRQEGLGVPVYEGSPIPALIITIAVKPESESERRIVIQLQNLKQEIQALRANPLVDPKLTQQLHQLSKTVASLQAQTVNNDQSIAIQLQNLAEDVTALPSSLNGNQDVLKQLQYLSKDVGTLQKQATYGDQNITTQLQKLAKDVAALQSSPNGNQDVLKQLQQLSQAIAAIAFSANNQGITKQLQKISQDIANIQPAQNDNEALIKKLQEVSTTNKTQTALNTKIWTRSMFVVYILLVGLIITSGFGLYYGSQAYNYFSNIQSALYSNSAATAIAANTYPSYLPGNETLALYDPLDGSSNKYQWDTTGSCSFANRSYNVSISQQNTFNDCVASATNFSNFAFEVVMTITKGDCGGVIFRADSANYKYYFLSICQDGTFSFSKYKANTPPYSDILLNSSKSTSYINKGLNHANIVAVVANKSNLMLYVNQHQIGSVTDNAYSQGQIGLLADNYSSPTTGVSYTNAKVWTF